MEVDRPEGVEVKNNDEISSNTITIGHGNDNNNSEYFFDIEETSDEEDTNNKTAGGDVADIAMNNS